MPERSEEQIISRLLELENDGEAERRTRLTGDRFLSLLHDPEDGRSYILRHGVDDTEGSEIPDNTEFYEYGTADEAQRAYDELLHAAQRAGSVVEEDSIDDIGDIETSGAELLDVYADQDEDELTNVDDAISEEEEP